MSDYDLLPFGAERKVVVDAGYMAAGRHVIHGLVEIDVTEARRLLRRRSEELGVKLSLTAFLVASLGRAVAAAPQVQAFRDWRGRLVVFHDVDVVTMIEPRPGAVAIPHVIRATQRKSVAEITAEIRAVQNRVPASGRQSRLTALAPHLPRFMRLLFFRILKLNPRWFRNMAGTVIVTSVGMFGGSGGWGIGFLPTHNLGVTVGGIQAVVAGGAFTAADVPLVEGSNLLEAVATDSFGHSATSNQIEIVLDTVPPTVAVSSPTEGVPVVVHPLAYG